MSSQTAQSSSGYENAVIENIMLSGWSLGVGSVCMGYPAESPDAKPRDFGKVRFVD